MSASCNATSAQLNTSAGKQHTNLHTHDNSNQRTKHKQPQG